ncbi:plasmid stabilization protein ParE [Pseudomonas aeruginosa]|nr:plasmid stabilization protein ParE [Pseudomonas aeruginosa]
MAKYRISHDAQADIVDILRFTHNRFGDARADVTRHS